MQLAQWVNSIHLETDRVGAMAERFASDPVDSIAIDDFLNPAPLEGLRALFDGDGHWVDLYLVRGGHANFTHVDRRAWLEAHPDEQFSTQLELKGAAPGREMSSGMIHHLQLERLAAQPATIDLLAAISGRPLHRFERAQPRIITSAHRLPPHNDFGQGRLLCAVLYLHRTWNRGAGGRFLQYRDEELIRAVDPVPNRLIIFSPSGHCKHAVESMTPDTDEWRRCTYSFWYH